MASTDQRSARSERRDDLKRRIYPESAIDGFTRRDGAVEFYTRVNALLGPESVVLDLGAGRGEWLDAHQSVTRRKLRNMRGRVGEVIGIDVEDTVHGNASLDRAIVIDPSDTLPLESSSVDLVISDFTFEHIADPAHTVSELTRVLRPGGWICARTPHKFGFIGLGARAVPNNAHTRWLSRLQPARREEDVFPVVYAMNTPSALRDLFPAPYFRTIVYGQFGEPNYAGGSRLLWSAFEGLRRIQPRSLGPMLHIFVQKIPRGEQ